MRVYWTLTRRELGSYFTSMTGYIVLAAVAFLIGLCFVALLIQVGQSATPMPVTELFYNTVYYWLVFLMAIPVVTMRLFALEKFSGTFETLMTAPVSDAQVVASKFSAALAFFGVMWLPLIVCTLVIRHFSSDASALDVGAMAGTYLGILLLGAVFIAAGCFASALTRSQMAAGMMAFLFGVSLFLLAFLADRFPKPTSWSTSVLSFFALFSQIHDFARGVIDTRTVVLYLSLTLFFLFLTLRTVESRHWK